MGKNELIYSDDEGSLSSNVIKEYFESQKIEIHRTRTHPALAKRFIRTFKICCSKELKQMSKRVKQITLTDCKFEIMITYNNKMVHSATDLTRQQAKKNENELKVKANIALNATKTRTYPELEKGAKVKIFREKDKLDKESKSNWLKEIQTIDDIKTLLVQKYFYISGRGYLRHELLKS